ncbi:hypothetical protein PDE_00518 [Penicillium oxalicum 114-2]|uniref:Uncharacterized protein n=1 Tax=Penicillium oxalicum (strain 114-2 / CGMCC 5302) TaxID=933388 RepID=S7Z630_PENO1|nr:hypothetical protein PDE_00518 [Penicillium oxalicum 114-2]
MEKGCVANSMPRKVIPVLPMSCQNRKQVGVWGEGMEKLWDKRVVVYQLSLGRGTAEDGNGGRFEFREGTEPLRQWVRTHSRDWDPGDIWHNLSFAYSDSTLVTTVYFMIMSTRSQSEPKCFLSPTQCKRGASFWYGQQASPAPAHCTGYLLLVSGVVSEIPLLSHDLTINPPRRRQDQTAAVRTYGSTWYVQSDESLLNSTGPDVGPQTPSDVLSAEVMWRGSLFHTSLAKWPRLNHTATPGNGTIDSQAFEVNMYRVGNRGYALSTSHSTIGP